MYNSFFTPSLQPSALQSIHIDAPVRSAERRTDGAPTTTGSVLLRVLDQLDYGVMLVGPTGQVRVANRIARRDCGDAASALRLVGEQLRARHEYDQQRLLRAIAGALEGRRSLLTVACPDGPRTLAVIPVDDPDASSLSEPAALVVLGRRQMCEPLTVDFFARSHTLTAAETGVLHHLANGRRPTDIARDIGVAITTVRSQITSIRLKTGSRNIGELMRLVTVLPPIVPLMMN